MEIEDCLKKDGKYNLVELGDLMSEFNAIIKNGKVKFQEIKLNPFKIVPVDEKKVSLMCDLHSSENWEFIK